MIETELPIERVRLAAQAVLDKEAEPKRVQSGSSTYVYRILHQGETWYLRILPEDASFEAEALAHDLLLSSGVRVPRILYVEAQNPIVKKSVMLTSEIPGIPIDESLLCAAAVLQEAGKDLARMNATPVDGFGWINRACPHELRGVHASFCAYFRETLDADMQTLAANGFDGDALYMLMAKSFTALDTKDAALAHGDFDVSHIFHNNGAYTGIIDFGEIRGSHRLYDLGHFRLHMSDAAFCHLAVGYGKIVPLEASDFACIDKLALFVGISRGKYAHYQNLLRRQLKRMGLQA